MRKRMTHVISNAALALAAVSLPRARTAASSNPVPGLASGSSLVCWTGLDCAIGRFGLVSSFAQQHQNAERPNYNFEMEFGLVTFVFDI